MLSRFHHAAVAVTNWKRSMDFYCKKLGMETVFEAEFDRNPQSEKVHGLRRERYCVALLAVRADLGGGLLELFHYRSPKGKRPRKSGRLCDPGWTHVCFVVDDADAVYREFRAKGIRFTAPPVVVETKGVKVLRALGAETTPRLGQVKGTFFRDPDGLLVEIIQLAK